MRRLRRRASASAQQHSLARYELTLVPPKSRRSRKRSPGLIDGPARVEPIHESVRPVAHPFSVRSPLGLLTSAGEASVVSAFPLENLCLRLLASVAA